MDELNFMTTTGDEYKIQCNSNDKIKNVCKKLAKTMGEDYKHLVFFANGSRINKKLTVQEFQKNFKSEVDYILVKIMDIEIEKDSSDEEKASNELRKKLIEEITNPNKNPTYERMQELIVQYGYDMEKRIEEDVKKNPEYFMDTDEAIKQEKKNKKLFVLGKLGESLQCMGIKIVIDKRENLKTDDYIINNQIISSGLLKNNKYEIHIEEEDNKKKYDILNDEYEQQKFIEEWKEKISNYTKIPKKDIYIANLREGSLKMDCIFKKIDIPHMNKKYIKINELMENFANSYPKIKEIYSKNILGACKLTLDMLDERGDQYPGNWAKPPAYRGGLEYFPPGDNWIGYGLKVLGQYDKGNNDWIAMNGNKNEWAVAYHGTKEKAVKPICSKKGKFFSTSQEGAIRQRHENAKNINKKSPDYGGKCGEGCYCSPHLNFAENYASGVIIMCRVNPKLIRIPQGFEKEWITDGTRNTIRPYRILYKLNK